MRANFVAYVFTTSWNNDQTPQASALHEQKGVKTAFRSARTTPPQDMLEGVASTFKGQIVGRE